MALMSYQFTITPREITVSPEALEALCRDAGVRGRGLDGFLEILRDSYGIDGYPEGYSAEGKPLLRFELQYFISPEREGLQGIIDRLKEGLVYADAQSFTITDEYGRTATYDHPGFGSENGR